MGDIRIVETTVADMLDQAKALFEAHRDELATYKDRMIVNPAVDSYEALEKAGNLLVLAVYKNDRLIGYSSTFLFKNFHYADLFYAQNDLLFIAKEHRDSLIGLRLIRATETKAKERGAQMMLWHAKENTPLASILERMKYRVQDIIFSKEL